MTKSEYQLFDFSQEDFAYGEKSPIEVVRLRPATGRVAIDPHYSLEHENQEPEGYPEVDIETKVQELTDNYGVFFDPDSPAKTPRHFGMTILNKDMAKQDKPAILVFLTHGSSLFDEAGNPNNEGNALELSFMALTHPENPIVAVELPGNGNSTDMTEDEYVQAMRDGRLIHARVDDGKLADFVAFETLVSLANTIESMDSQAETGAKIRVGYVTGNAMGAHFASAFQAAAENNSLAGFFNYGPTNISDRSWPGLTVGNVLEAMPWRQARYSKSSHDPQRMTPERKEAVRRIMGSVAKRKIDLARASTHNPLKLVRQQKIASRGDKHGHAAAIHAVAGQMRHERLRQTIVFPEFASQYKRPQDFLRYMSRISLLGGQIVEQSDLESLKLPMAQYGHSHYPTVRQTLQRYSFNR